MTDEKRPRWGRSVTGAADDDAGGDVNDGPIHAEVELREGGYVLGDPDVLGVGGVFCRCGVLKFSNVTGTPQTVSMQSRCPECDDIVELIAEAVQPCECGRIVGPAEHHCWWHHTDENPEGAYRVCGECFHVWRTADDLEYACREVNGGRHVPAEKIDACPECCHDF